MAIVVMVVADEALLKVAEEAQELGRSFDTHLQTRFSEFLLSTDPAAQQLAGIQGAQGAQSVLSDEAQQREAILEQLLIAGRNRTDQYTFKELAASVPQLANATQQEVTKYAGLFAKATKNPGTGVRNLGKQGGNKGVTLYGAAIPQNEPKATVAD